MFLDCSANVSLFKNGFCNDEVNNADCNFDGGDCCVDINADHCSNCTCHHQDNCVAGFTPSVIGDGFCNDGANNADCNFDGGDCCGCVLKNHCTECACLGGADVINPHIGNGICNDEANNAACYFDNGDCCKGQIFCTEIKILSSESHDLGLLSLYTFSGKCVYFSIFEW